MAMTKGAARCRGCRSKLSHQLIYDGPDGGANGWWREPSGAKLCESSYAISRFRGEAHVALLEIDRPPNNQVSVELIARISPMRSAISMPRTSCVPQALLPPQPFCAGADLTAPNRHRQSGRGPRHNALLSSGSSLFQQKPTSPAVQGSAVGAGLGLAPPRRRFRVAKSPEARFTANLREARVSSPALGSTHHWPRLIGRATRGVDVA